MTAHLSDQFYLLYKHLHTSLQVFIVYIQVFRAYFRAITNTQSKICLTLLLKLLNKIPATSLEAYIFTNFLLTSPLDKTTDISTNNLFKNSDIVHDLKKSEFKDLLSLATKESYFIFNNILYKQIAGVSTGSPLGPSLTNAFLAHHEQNWLDSCPLEYRPSYY